MPDETYIVANPTTKDEGGKTIPTPMDKIVLQKVIEVVETVNLSDKQNEIERWKADVIVALDRYNHMASEFNKAMESVKLDFRFKAITITEK